MLQLKNITKDYVVTDELTVHALKNVSLTFRPSEFVSVLGPSGCGKTTLLNIIGGLDRYTSGDLVIDGTSTESFRDADWDSYRNRSIGFVFQSYNLIPHMSVLENVALSLTFAGAGKAERRKRAKEALCSVGLGEQINKRPNQLSGGQMQRVAIARAIVGDPKIILADEPTGALDTETGVQVMDLLKEISRDRLVILVTHNEQLAEQYSTRVIKILDGCVVGDSDPVEQTEEVEFALPNVGDASVNDTPERQPARGKKGKWGKFFASIVAAFGISFRNLRSKRGRTFLTAFAGSIGIFGIAMVLALSGGMSNFVDYMQTEAVGDSAVTIGETAYSVSRILSIMGDMEGVNEKPYPDVDYVVPYERQSFHTSTTLSDEFLDYIGKLTDDPEKSKWCNAVTYGYNLNMNVLMGNKYLASWSSYAYQAVDGDGLIEDNYDVLYKSDDSATGYPQNITEVCLVVNKFNRLTPSALRALGMTLENNEDGTYKAISFEDIIRNGRYTVVLNDGWYTKKERGYASLSSSVNGKTGMLPDEAVSSIKDGDKLEVRIVGILRPKNDNSTQWLSSGLAYLPEFASFLVQNATESQIGKEQLANKTVNVMTGTEFSRPQFGTDEEKDSNVRYQYTQALKAIGAYKTPTTVKIYPKSIDSKQKISDYIDAWNDAHPDDEVLYLDLTGLALSLMATLIDVVSWVLIAFSAVSLIVSTVMISVITYTSVVERTKEIGVLRSIGASKGDVSSIFNAETAIIGTFAGLLGVAMALLLGFAVNLIVERFLGVAKIAAFTVWIVLGMFALSVALTVFAGLIPARIAAKRDPVKCLRTE